jgi:hypothetical protein
MAAEPQAPGTTDFCQVRNGRRAAKPITSAKARFTHPLRSAL